MYYGMVPTFTRVLDRNSVYDKKNDEFNFSVKLISELMCLVNVIVLDNLFSLKSLNVVITNYGFEFNSIIAVLDNSI